MFDVTSINLIRNYFPKGRNKIESSRWIMYTFLHEWNRDLEVTLITMGDKIQQLFKVDCPKTKL